MTQVPHPFWQRWGPSIGLCLTLFVVAYSVSLVPAIMPRIVRDLNSSVGYVQGALVLLALIKASFTPTCENLSQRYGRKQVFVTGLLVFTVGAIAASASLHVGHFVAAYSLIIGIGATPLVGSPRAIMGSLYTDKAEKFALLALAIASILGGLTGSLLGGWIASNIGWRWAFLPELLLVPVILVLVRPVSSTRRSRAEPIDWVGGLFSFGGVGLLLLGVSLSGEYGWWEPKRIFSIFGLIIPPFSLSVVPVLIAVGVICLGFFMAWQRQQIAHGKATLLRLGLLRYVPFLMVIAVATLHTLVTTGLQFNLYQFVPAVFGTNPFRTAIAIIPFQVALLIAIVISTFKLVGRLPPRLIIYGGLSLFSIGIWQLYRVIRPDIQLGDLLLPLIIMGSGSGLFLSQISILAFSTVRHGQRAEAGGIYTPFQNLGSALGRGILGTVLISIASTKIVDKAIAELGQPVSTLERSGAISTLQRVIQTYSRQERGDFFRSLPDAIQPALDTILNTSAIEAMQVAVLLALGFSLACLGVALLVPRRYGRP